MVHYYTKVGVLTLLLILELGAVLNFVLKTPNNGALLDLLVSIPDAIIHEYVHCV